MNKLTPQRRRIVILAAIGGIVAALPLLLFSSLTGPPRHLMTGVCLGISASCLVYAMVHLTRCRRTGQY